MYWILLLALEHNRHSTQKIVFSKAKQSTIANGKCSRWTKIYQTCCMYERTPNDKVISIVLLAMRANHPLAVVTVPKNDDAIPAAACAAAAAISSIL